MKSLLKALIITTLLYVIIFSLAVLLCFEIFTSICKTLHYFSAPLTLFNINQNLTNTLISSLIIYLVIVTILYFLSSAVKLGKFSPIQFFIFSSKSSKTIFALA